MLTSFVSGGRCSCGSIVFVYDEQTRIQYPIYPVPPQDNRIYTEILYYTSDEDLKRGWIACNDLRDGKEIQFIPLDYLSHE